MHDELVKSLKETLESLEYHLRLESEQQNISVKRLCFCFQEEISRARAVLAKAEKGGE
jgi:hypothetical protein